MSQGQIQLNTELGKILYHFCRNNQNIKTVVEIGTWYGAGSTECIILGLNDSKKDNVSFFTLETNQQMYNVAVNWWKDKLPEWAKLIHGGIVNSNEMDDSNLGYQHPDESKWFKEDKNALASCPNVLNQLPNEIDLLFLDGGEFTTKAEFFKLENRSKIIILDDTTARKCKDIRTYVIDNQTKYKILFDQPEYRNGIMGFEKIKQKPNQRELDEFINGEI